MSIKHINIPEPCHQKWEDMTLSNDGRFCGSCAKTVIDFTVMNNEQIIKYLSAKGNVCGRLEQWQLTSVNRQLNHTKAGHGLKGLVVSLSLFFAIPAFKLQAQHKPAKVHVMKGKSNAVKADSLIARYAGYQLLKISSDSTNFKPKDLCQIDERREYVLGGAIAVQVVNRPVYFFRDGFYQNVYDLLQNIMKL